MYSVKKFFRNVPTGILMILGFSILMFMIFNTLTLLNSISFLRKFLEGNSKGVQ